jgi:hypothetical protein
MVTTINQSGGENSLPKETFDRVFDMWWPQINEKVTKILAEDNDTNPEQQRSDRDILEEILIISRAKNRNPSPSRGPVPHGFLVDFLTSIERLISHNAQKEDTEIQSINRSLLKLSEYLVT